MFKLKIGTLIWDNLDQEWGTIVDYLELEQPAYITAWTTSSQQTFYDHHFKIQPDRFEFYEV
jgi:hypothetical protein